MNSTPALSMAVAPLREHTRHLALAKTVRQGAGPQELAGSYREPPSAIPSNWIFAPRHGEMYRRHASAGLKGAAPTPTFLELALTPMADEPHEKSIPRLPAVFVSASGA